MTRGRSRSLLIRAVAQQAVDLSRHDPFGAAGRYRIRAVLEEIARRDVAAGATTALSLVGVTDIVAAVRKTEAVIDGDQRNSLWQDYLRALYPWLADTLGESTAVSGDDIADLYHSVIGAPGSPEYEAALQALAEMQRLREQQAVTNPTPK